VKQALSLSQLRLVPKVGQWGQLKSKGVSLQCDYKDYKEYLFTTRLDTSTYNKEC
jgi:hypothetical protein